MSRNTRAVLRRHVLCTLSATALTLTAARAFAQEPPPAAPAASETQLSEVVVTGTRIRGVTAVGSATVTLDQQAILDQGLTSVADTLNTVPFVLKEGAGNDYAGGGGQSGSSLNGLAFNKSPNLRGFGPQATLSLVDGHRVPYEGANMNAFDGDNLPAQALSRVEIVADGTSPIYGADAVAGTVNYVLRDPFTGVETYAQYGTDKGQNGWQATLVGGLKWSDEGGVIFTYQFTQSDPLFASSRPELYNDDYSAFGGPPSSTFSSPGNVIVNGVPYAIPRGQNGSALTLAQLGPAGVANTQNSWTGYDALPGFGRNIATVNFKQGITDWLEVFGDGFYSDRYFNMALIAEGDGTTVTVPNSNYYSPCNRSLTGAPAALLAACQTGSLNVNYNTVYDSGPVTRDGYSKTWDGMVGLRFKLPDDWSATVEASKGTHDEQTNNSYFFGNSLPLSPALAGTTATTAYNVFCDGSEFMCNSPALAAGNGGANWLIESRFDIRDYTINFDGPVMTLPGGKLRVAVGGEHQQDTFTNTNNFGTSVDERSISAGYIEAYVPIVGEANALPGIRKLEIDGAGRADSYSDVGTTVNPKVGVNWIPIQDVKLHGSFGTSFRAPGLADNDPFSQQGFLVPGFSGSSINPALCPTCAGVPGGFLAYQALGGANHDLQPEKSRSWSGGVEWTPELLRGLDLSANYWTTNYTNQVSYPVYNAGAFAAINQQYYNNYIIYNPTYFPQFAASNPVAFFGNFPTINQSLAPCAAVYGKRVTTQALYNQMIACINAGGDGGLFGAPGMPASVLAVEDGHRINAGVTNGQGFDLQAFYSFDNPWGNWRVGATGELILKWLVAPISGAPETEVVNSFLYPLRFRGRAQFDWNKHLTFGQVGAHLFVNYDNSYHIDPAFLPGGVSSAYTNIASYTTVDLTLTYDSGTDPQWKLARNAIVTFSVQNLFDRDPPLVINDTSIGGIMFDNLVASPLGRVIQIQIGKKW
jgi:iron complex outermembrane recepter protein